MFRIKINVLSEYDNKLHLTITLESTLNQISSIC